MVHFTYSSDINDDLCQGDVLEKNDELKKIISEVHPYFDHPQYTHFIVLTQSCDLVRRNGEQCGAHYITLAAVRSLKDALVKKLDDSLINLGDEYVISEARKSQAIGLLKELLNNNEKSHFFLKAESGLAFPEDSCAFLLVSIAIKSELHYKACYNAKVLSLTPVFQSKLGWLVGNLYSRVGTVDYPEALELQSKQFTAEVQSLLDEHLVTVSKDVFSELKKISKLEADLEQLIIETDTRVKEKRSSSRSSKLTSIVKDIGKIITLSKQQEQQLGNALAQNSIVRKAIDG